MEKNWKIITLLFFAVVIILLVINLWRGSGSINKAIDKLSESQRMLDKATATIQSSQEMVAALQSNMSNYAVQVRHTDSLVTGIEENRVRREADFVRRVSSAQTTYNELKNKMDKVKRRDWPVVTIDTIP
jgi:hypothetical protein